MQSDSAGARARPSLDQVDALDGVRAIAVLGVLLYHGGVSWLHGGFLGVDVFFVLSGFLITSLLLTELEATGRLSLLRFYERRARRLLPGLCVLVLLVGAFVDFVLPHGSDPSLPRQVLGTMLYVGNWTLIANHTLYFTQGLPPSPLEHTWSLAIEEQFYLLWPAALIVLTRFVRTRNALAVAAVTAAVCFATVTAIQFQLKASANTLYFSSQTHATTMFLGVALAFVLLRHDRVAIRSHYVRASARLRGLTSAGGVVGWAGVVALFFVVRGAGPFLYRGGFLAVGAIVVVAIAGTVCNPDGPAARLLALPPVTFIGRISYGLYLYHFPLFLWLDAQRLHLGGAPLLFVRLAVTFIVAVSSYYLVEQPIRQRRVLRHRRGLAVAAGSFVATGVLAFSAASAATTVPFADRSAWFDFAASAPPGTKTVALVVGDSMALTLGNGLNTPTTRAAHAFFAVDAVPECSLVGAMELVKGFVVDPPRRCDAAGRRGWPERWTRQLHRWHPEVSLVLFRGDLFDQQVFGSWQHVGQPQFDCVLWTRLLDAAEVLSSNGRPVILLTSPLYDSGEQDNGAPWPEDSPSRVRTYDAILREFASRFPTVVHVVDLGAIVSPDGRFSRTIGSTVLRWVDGVHFTYAGDNYVVGRLLPQVLAIARRSPSRAQLQALRRAAILSPVAACSGVKPRVT